MSIDDTWAKLSANIREIHKHNASNLSFEENHRFAYNMVLHKNGAMLYKGVCELVAENLVELANTEVVPAFPTTGDGDRMQQTQEGETLLKALRRIWADHISSMSKLRDILKYMVCSDLRDMNSWLNPIRTGCTPRLRTCLRYGTQDMIYFTSTSYDPQ